MYHFVILNFGVRYHLMSDQLFNRLKSILRARDITYADVADRMGVSEVTIKRTFAEKDCKLSRLSAICRAVGIDLHELIEMESQSLPVPTPLKQEQSKALADHPALFSVFMMVLNHYRKDQLKRVFGLSEERLYRYLRELEALRLVRVDPVSGEASLTVPVPVEFVGDPQLANEVRRINEAFVTWVFEHKTERDYAFETLSRQMTRESADIIMKDLEDIAERMQRLAQRDSLMAPKDQLQGFKFTGAFGPVPYNRLFAMG